MNTFPTNPPRKRRTMQFKTYQGGWVDVETPYVEAFPFTIHRRITFEHEQPLVGKQWQVSVTLMGCSTGIVGSYKYCKAVAEELFEYPSFYLPTAEMFTSHPDFHDMARIVSQAKQRHAHL